MYCTFNSILIALVLKQKSTYVPVQVDRRVHGCAVRWRATRLASRVYARSGALLLESSPERACVLQARSLRSRPRLLADIGRLLSLLQSCATRAALLHAALILPRALVPLGHQARRQLAHRHRCRRAESAKEPCGSANGGRVQRSAVPGPSGNRSRVPTEGLCTLH